MTITEYKKIIKGFSPSEALTYSDCITTDNGKESFRKLIRKAATMEEFENSVLSSDELSWTSFYAHLSKKDSKHWYRVRAMLGKGDFFKTGSDVGSVKIGNGEMSILVSNGHGDGETRISIMDKQEFNPWMMKYMGIVLSGKIKIFAYDCGDEVIKELEGKYAIYVHSGMVAFVEWN